MTDMIAGTHTDNDLTKTERRRRDFEETTRFAFEASEQYLQDARDKTERLRALRLARERGEH